MLFRLFLRNKIGKIIGIKKPNGKLRKSTMKKVQFENGSKSEKKMTLKFQKLCLRIEVILRKLKHFYCQIVWDGWYSGSTVQSEARKS